MSDDINWGQLQLCATCFCFCSAAGDRQPQQNESLEPSVGQAVF